MKKMFRMTVIWFCLSICLLMGCAKKESMEDSGTGSTQESQQLTEEEKKINQDMIDKADQEEVQEDKK